MKTSITLTAALTAIVTISCFNLAYGLRCHVCIYGNQVPGSDPKCVTEPNHLETCSDVAGQKFDIFNQTNKPLATAFKKLRPTNSTGTGSNRAIYDPLCGTYEATVQGYSYVFRECDIAYTDDNWNNKCEELKEEVDGILVTFKACYCNDNDGCNNKKLSVGGGGGAGSLTVSLVTMASISLVYFLK